MDMDDTNEHIGEIILCDIYRYRSNNSEIYQNPTTGLWYIKSYLEHNSNFKCKILASDNLSMMDKIQLLIKENKKQIIGFSCYEDNYSIIKNVIYNIKQKYTNLCIVVGGPEFTASNGNVIDDLSADYGIIGDGEHAMLQLANFFYLNEDSRNSIPNLVYRDGEKILRNTTKTLENLDHLPFPEIDYSNSEKMYVVSGRGCPNRCTFCFDGNKRTSFRSVQNVIEEINYNLEKYPNLKIIHFIDDTFTLSKESMERYCEYFSNLLKERDISWICEAHFNILNRYPQLIKKMVQSGLKSIHFGIESGNDYVLKAYNKNTSVQMMLDVVQKLCEEGIEEIEGNIIVGGPYESEETIKNNIKFVKDLIQVAPGILSINTVFLWPYNGTTISKYSEKYDVSFSDDLKEKSISSLQNCVVSTKVMNRQEIINAKRTIDNAIDIIMTNEAAKFQAKDLWRIWDKKTFSFKNIWGNAINKYPYMVNYLHYESLQNNETSWRKIPLRTFELIEYEEDMCLKIGSNRLYGLEKAFLEGSNGKNTFEMLVQKLGITEKEGLELYQKLNNLCLVTMVPA
jgi:radical SAM superfamily enzyme YgiQ (UPF0313 family)